MNLFIQLIEKLITILKFLKSLNMKLNIFKIFLLALSGKLI